MDASPARDDVPGAGGSAGESEVGPGGGGGATGGKPGSDGGAGGAGGSYGGMDTPAGTGGTTQLDAGTGGAILIDAAAGADGTAWPDADGANSIGTDSSVDTPVTPADSNPRDSGDAGSDSGGGGSGGSGGAGGSSGSGGAGGSGAGGSGGSGGSGGNNACDITFSVPISGVTLDQQCRDYGIAGPYHGFFYTSVDSSGTSSICPACTATGCEPWFTTSICAKGVAGMAKGGDFDTYWGANLGWNISQPSCGAASAPTPVDLTGKTLSLTLVNPPSSLYLQVISAGTIFCTDISGQASVSVPVTSLKRECWTGGANTAISAGEMAAVSRIELAVYTNPTSSVPFDYCVAALSIGSPPTVTITGQGSFATYPTFFGANYWCWMDRYGNDLESIKTQVADLGLKVLRAGGHNLDINGGVSGTSYELDPFDDAQIDTFVAYAQSIGAEPILQVPLLKDTSGSPATAAAAAHMVTYANITKSYGIRHWIIGNEPDIYVSQGDQPSSYSVSDYCASVSSYAAAMKAVDPTIKLLGPELAWADSGWLASVLGTCGAQFDIITVHRYPFDPAAATFASAKGDAPNFRATIDELRAAMTSAGLSRPLGITEANITWDGEPAKSTHDASPGTFHAGLWGADTIGVALEKDLWTYDFWSLSEWWTLGMYDGEGHPRPLAEMLRLIAEHWGSTVLTVPVQPSGVRVYASRDEAEKMTAFMLINWNGTDSTQTVRFQDLPSALANLTVPTPATSLTLVRVPDGGRNPQAWCYAKAHADAGLGPQPVSLP
jgi:hypothetical protein